MSGLDKLLAASEQLVELHGEKGKPGYHLLHSPTPSVAEAANKIYKKFGQRGVSTATVADVVSGKSPDTSVVKHLPTIAAKHGVGPNAAPGGHENDKSGAAAKVETKPSLPEGATPVKSGGKQIGYVRTYKTKEAKNVPGSLHAKYYTVTQHDVYDNDGKLVYTDSSKSVALNVLKNLHAPNKGAATKVAAKKLPAFEAPAGYYTGVDSGSVHLYKTKGSTDIKGVAFDKHEGQVFRKKGEGWFAAPVSKKSTGPFKTKDEALHQLVRELGIAPAGPAPSSEVETKPSTKDAPSNLPPGSSAVKEDGKVIGYVSKHTGTNAGLGKNTYYQAFDAEGKQIPSKGWPGNGNFYHLSEARAAVSLKQSGASTEQPTSNNSPIGVTKTGKPGSVPDNAMTAHVDSKIQGYIKKDDQGKFQTWNKAGEKSKSFSSLMDAAQFLDDLSKVETGGDSSDRPTPTPPVARVLTKSMLDKASVGSTVTEDTDSFVKQDNGKWLEKATYGTPTLMTSADLQALYPKATLEEPSAPAESAPSPGLVEVGGLKVTQGQLQEAIATLEAAKGIMVKQPLAKKNNPLANVDYKAVAKAQNPNTTTKPGFIEHLKAKLAAPKKAEPASAAPPPVSVPTPSAPKEDVPAGAPPVGTHIKTPAEMDALPPGTVLKTKDTASQDGYFSIKKNADGKWSTGSGVFTSKDFESALKFSKNPYVVDGLPEDKPPTSGPTPQIAAGSMLKSTDQLDALPTGALVGMNGFYAKPDGKTPAEMDADAIKMAKNKDGSWSYVEKGVVDTKTSPASKLHPLVTGGYLKLLESPSELKLGDTVKSVAQLGALPKHSKISTGAYDGAPVYSKGLDGSWSGPNGEMTSSDMAAKVMTGNMNLVQVGASGPKAPPKHKVGDLITTPADAVALPVGTQVLKNGQLFTKKDDGNFQGSAGFYTPHALVLGAGSGASSAKVGIFKLPDGEAWGGPPPGAPSSPPAPAKLDPDAIAPGTYSKLGGKASITVHADGSGTYTNSKGVSKKIGPKAVKSNYAAGMNTLKQGSAPAVAATPAPPAPIKATKPSVTALKTNLAPVGTGEEVAPGIYSGISHALVQEVAKAGADGHPTFYSGTDLEDNHVIIQNVKMGGQDAHVASLQLRGSGATKLKNKLAEMQTADTSTGEVDDSALGQFSQKSNSLYASMINGIKNVSQHAKDGKYNEGEITQLKTTVEQAKSEKAEYLKDPAAFMDKHYPEAPGAGPSHLDMLDYYISRGEQSLAAKDQGMPSLPGFAKVPNPPASVFAPPTAPEVPQLSVKYKVTKRNVTGSDGEFKDGQLHLNQPSALPGGHQQEYFVELPSGAQMVYRPGTEFGTPSSRRYTLQFTTKDASPEALQEMEDFLQEMGVNLGSASTKDDHEAAYWSRLYNTLQDRSDRNASKGAQVTKQFEELNPDKAKTPAERAALWRQVWAAYDGTDKVDAFVKRDGFLPRLSRTVTSGGGRHGRPQWDRFDVTPEQARKGKTPLNHSITGGASKLVALSGGLLTTEERPRVLGKFISGMSSSSDQAAGSANYVFTRQNLGYSGSILMDPALALRTNSYSFNGDNYGKINLRKTQSYMDFNKHTAPSSGSNELMLKYGVSFLDNLFLMTVNSDQEKADIIEYYTDRGITEIRGVPLSQVFVTTSERQSAAAAVKERMESGWYDTH